MLLYKEVACNKLQCYEKVFMVVMMPDSGLPGMSVNQE